MPHKNVYIVNEDADEQAPAPADQESKPKLVKTAIVDWTSSTTGHGFPNLTRNSRLWRKLIWSLCIAGIIGYIIYGRFKRKTF